MEVKLVRDGFRNYLLIEEIEVKEEQYETQMMLQNDLSYFLKLEIRGINQERKYCYCINSKQSLKRVLELKNIGFEELKTILMGLLSALKQLKEYFLKEDRVYLNLDSIYTELERSEIYLCYIPGYYENIGIQVRNLMEQFMDTIDHTDSNAVVLIYGLYRITRQENYTLADLEDFIYHISKEEFPQKDTNNKKQGEKQLILDELFGGKLLEDEKKMEGWVKEEDQGKKANWDCDDFEEKEDDTKRKNGNIRFQMEYETDLKKKKRGKWWYIALIFDFVVGVCITYLVILLMNRGLNMKGILGLGILTLAFLSMSFFAARKEEDVREEEEEMQKAILRSRQFQEESWYEEESYEEVYDKEFFEEETYGELNSERIQEKHENYIENQNKTTVLYEESVPKLNCVGKKEESILLDHFPFIIGSRKENSDYAITEKGVSRMHADISFEGGMYFITDLNSTNGTYINGKEIETGTAVQLKNGDEIRIAKRRLVIEGIG